MVARQKAELAVKEAVVARAEAEDRAAQVALKNIPAIADALKQLVAGNKEVAQSFDFSQVSVRNMVNSIIALASEGSKLPPTGLKVMQTLMDVLSKDTTNAIDKQQRLAIVQQLSQRNMISNSSAAFELVAALARGREETSKFENAVKGFSFTGKKAEEDVKAFRDQLTLFGNAIDNVNRELSAAATPVFTAMIKGLTDSLRDSDGILHTFVIGIGELGRVIGSLVEAGKQALDTLGAGLDKLFNQKAGSGMREIIMGLVAAVGLFASAWLAIPATIATVIVVIGYIRDHLTEIGKAIDDNAGKFGAIVAIVTAIVGFLMPWTVILGAIGAAIVLVYENWDKVKQSIADNSAVQAVIGFFKSVYDWASKIATEIKGWFSGGTPNAPSNGTQTASEGGNVDNGGVKAATGGHIRGPGTGTSDSIPAMLSDGEYVVRSAAVQKFGVGFMHAINSMMLPGFATGGLVGVPARTGAPGAVQASRALNLTIGDRTFSGLRGPAKTINDLQSYATSRQVSSAGRRPSWES